MAATEELLSDWSEVSHIDDLFIMVSTEELEVSVTVTDGVVFVFHFIMTFLSSE
jgi:hypothetical protein